MAIARACSKSKKKRSIRTGILKANKASETEEQRIERLRIGREKIEPEG